MRKSFYHLYKSRTKFQCCSLFPSWVIRPPMAASVPLFIFLCCYTDFIKMEQTIEKSQNFQQMLLNTRPSFSQNFNDVATFVLELLGFVCYIYTIFSCSFSEITKNGTNNWKITKLSGNTFEQLGKLQSIFQWHSFIRSCVSNVVASFVLELLGFVFYIYTSQSAKRHLQDVLKMSYQDKQGMLPRHLADVLNANLKDIFVRHLEETLARYIVDVLQKTS